MGSEKCIRDRSCISDILKDILNICHGRGRVYIFEYDKTQTHHSCIYEVVSEGVSAEKDSLQCIPTDESKWWSQQILSGKPIVLHSLKQLPEEAVDEYQILVVQGITSLMVTPLMAGDHVWGYMGIDLVDTIMNGVMKIFRGSLHWEISLVFASN